MVDGEIPFRKSFYKKSDTCRYVRELSDTAGDASPAAFCRQPVYLRKAPLSRKIGIIPLFLIYILLLYHNYIYNATPKEQKTALWKM